MARRGGLGQRGLNLLIPDGPANEEKSKKAEKTQSGSSKSKTTAAKQTVSKKPAAKKTAAKKADVKKPETKKADGKKPASDARNNDADNENIAANAMENDLQQTIVSKPAAVTEIKNEPLMVSVNKVEPNKEQPRKNFDEDALQELADSIKTYGVIEPLIVLQKDGYYEIVAGERRWRAARLAGLKEVPVIVRDFDRRQTMEISLIENIQREDLSPIEEARAYQQLIEEFGLKQDELAERVSKSRAAVANSMRLLKLDPRVQEMLSSEMLSAGHARALLAIEDGDLQYKTAQQIFDDRLSVRDVEKLVKKLSAKPAVKKESLVTDALKAIYEQMEEHMKSSLGTKVHITSKTPEKGKIEIEYFSKDEMERIYDILTAARS